MSPAASMAGEERILRRELAKRQVFGFAAILALLAVLNRFLW